MIDNCKTFVVFGNMDCSFDRLLDFLFSNLDSLPKPIVVQLGYNNVPKDFHASIVYFNFCSVTEFNNLISKAEVVVAHCGVGVILASLKTGKIPIVLPRLMELREHTNNHQLELCNYLKSLDGIIYLASEVSDLNMLLAKRKLVNTTKVLPSLFDNSKIAENLINYLNK